MTDRPARLDHSHPACPSWPSPARRCDGSGRLLAIQIHTDRVLVDQPPAKESGQGN